MAIASWTTSQCLLSVEINGTYLPFKTAPDLMQRFVRPALFSTGDSTFELQYSGTALVAKYHDWHFCLTTKHQAEGQNAPNPEKFVVLVKKHDKQLAVPPKGLRIPTFSRDTSKSFEDLLFYDYNGIDPSVAPDYLDLTDMHWNDATHLKIDYSFVIGYPHESVQIELKEDDQSLLERFTLRWIRQDLESAEPGLLDPENRTIFVKHNRSTRISIDPDGLSGSPVFSICHAEDLHRHLRFEGIITHAAGDRFAIYPSEWIRDMLEDILGEER